MQLLSQRLVLCFRLCAITECKIYSSPIILETKTIQTAKISDQPQNIFSNIHILVQLPHFSFLPSSHINPILGLTMTYEDSPWIEHTLPQRILRQQQSQIESNGPKETRQMRINIKSLSRKIVIPWTDKLVKCPTMHCEQKDQ